MKRLCNISLRNLRKWCRVESSQLPLKLGGFLHNCKQDQTTLGRKHSQVGRKDGQSICPEGQKKLARECQGGNAVETSGGICNMDRAIMRVMPTLSHPSWMRWSFGMVPGVSAALQPLATFSNSSGVKGRNSMPLTFQIRIPPSRILNSDRHGHHHHHIRLVPRRRHYDRRRRSRRDGHDPLWAWLR
jgi:hypothetical protein